MITAGSYEGAFPTVDKAYFEPELSKQFSSFDAAIKNLYELCGEDFMDEVNMPDIGEYAGLPQKNDLSEPIRTKFYCPLTVGIDDPEENEFEYAETDPSILASHEDIIRDAVEAETHRGGDKDMSEYFHGSEDVREKLISARWDIENVGGTVYGCIHADLTEPLTEDEKEELRGWILGQNSDGWGEGFEQRPVTTPDGDLYISFWDSGDDYFLLDDEEFEQHLSGSQQMGGYE